MKMEDSAPSLWIDNTLLFLNLSRKAQVIWKRFEDFQKLDKTHAEGTLVGFYPSRDLYSESTWGIYEIRRLDNEKGKYVCQVWDYRKPMQRGTPTHPLDYFEMRPEYTEQSYKPIHYYKTDHMLVSTIKKLHPKLSEYVYKSTFNKD